MPAVNYIDLALWLEEATSRARVATDRLRTLCYGTDASFYRLIPRIVVTVESEAEVIGVMAACSDAGAPVTFRAAGTSLSGQAITDSVLIVLGEGWQGSSILEDGHLIALQPGIIGAEANRRLAPFARKIGPDPASIGAAMIGGIAANNASGMCCGTAQNSYQTLQCLRVVLADGTVLDTGSSDSRAGVRCGSSRASGRTGGACPRGANRPQARRPNPAQIRDQEHDRLFTERACRLPGPFRYPSASDDRVGGHARLHLRDHLSDRSRPWSQGLRAAVLRNAGGGLPGGDAAQARAGGGRRTDGSGQPRLR